MADRTPLRDKVVELIRAMVAGLPAIVAGLPAIVAGVLLTCAPLTEARTHPLQQPAGADLQTMIDCPAWIDSLGRCFQPDSAAPVASTTSAYDGAGPDYAGARRDTYYFLGLQLTVVGALYLMPESVSGWSDEQKNQHHLRKWWNNVSNPDWDEDEHYINYVLHPYWGAAYYVRARERGFDARGAFWYSFLLSTLYEAGLEAFFEPVSIQDFFVTPIVGSWLGGHFMRWRDAAEQRMRQTDDPRFRDRALLVATDPLGHAADFVDRRLGRSLEFHAAPFVSDMPLMPLEWASGAGSGIERETQRVYGIKLNVHW